MNADQSILNELLSYLYGSFLVTYALCIIGTLIKEILSSSSKKKKKISIKGLIFVPIPITAIICAARDIHHINFSLYVLICLAGGAGSGYVANIFINNRIVAYAVKAGANVLSDNKLLNVLSEMFDQQEEEEKEEADKRKKNKQQFKNKEDSNGDGETESCEEEKEDTSTELNHQEDPVLQSDGPDGEGVSADDVDEEENAAKSPFKRKHSEDADPEE